ncbi:phosphate acetyltransferase [Candidatus Woesearchaeota archaeon]|nr:phosphate acetyltransferase [Candidatus Woesearchaeota archaeon]
MKNLIKIMKDKAKAKRRKIVIGEGWEERCLKAADYVLREGYADLVLLGDEKKINDEAKKLNVDITAAEIINNKTSDMREKLAKELAELRKHKGMTEEKAMELLDDVNYFGCMLLHTGYADGFAGSAICSTAELMRPALQIIKTKPDASLVSETVIMNDTKNDRVLFFSDCSLNIDPDDEQLAQMAVNAGDMAKSFSFKPKVALLSFSTKGSGGDAPIIQKTLKAAEIAQKKRPDYIIDAEYQGDAAINPKAAAKKCSGARIQGDANVLVFPNLTAANITAHLLGQLSDMKMEMSSLMGIRKPVMILGRSTPPETVTNLIIMAAMEANVNE